MTLVVADTSPLNYLILIDAIDVLPQLYGVIVVPGQVIVELVDPGRRSRTGDSARQRRRDRQPVHRPVRKFSPGDHR
jgi:predicted nucleic acid-binding protein